MQFLNKNKKYFYRLLPIGFFSFVGIFVLRIRGVVAALPPPPPGVDQMIYADALKGAAKELIGTPFRMAGEAALELFNWFLYAIFYAVHWLVAASVKLFDVALNLTGLTNVEAVETGWGVSLGLVNLFFVLVLLVIAFATILKIESYGIKALLPKLIIIALLINFSFVICGVIIDFTQILTDFFVQASGQGKGIAVDLMDGLKITNLMELENLDNPAALKPSPSITDNLLVISLGLIMGIVVETIAAFIFLAGAILMVVRIVALWFLIIIAPLAWFFFILPATRSMWVSWWKQFFKWAFFAPAYAFFIYITLLIVTGGQDASSTSRTTFIERIMGPGGKTTMPMTDQGAQFYNAWMKTPELILQYVLVCGLLIASLITAQKMGIHGSNYAIRAAKWGGGLTGINKVKRMWAGRQSAMKDIAEDKTKAKKAERRLGRVGQYRQRIREAMPGTSGRESRAKKNELITKESQRMGKTMSPEDIYNVAGQRRPLTAAGKMKKLAAQNLLANPDSNEHKQMMSRQPSAGSPKFNKLETLRKDVDLEISRKKTAGDFSRYRFEKEPQKNIPAPTRTTLGAIQPSSPPEPLIAPGTDEELKEAKKNYQGR